MDELMLTPLEDPGYDPAWKPVKGMVPDVVERWGPRSQLRWFNRFRDELSPQKIGFWDRFYCSSAQHRGNCCVSCIADEEEGYREWEDHCCCRGYREGAD